MEKLKNPTPPLEAFTESVRQKEKEEKAQEQFNKMESECYQSLDEAIGKSNLVKKSAQDVIEAFFVVVGHIEERNYEAAHHQWLHINEELLRTLNAQAAEFFPLAKNAVQKFYTLNELAGSLMPTEKVEEVERELLRAGDSVNEAVKEVAQRKNHYEESENVTRYWTGG